MEPTKEQPQEQHREIERTTNHWKGAQWIALYTSPRAEKQVEQRLLREGYECYLPIVRERHQWSDRMQWVEKPLIASYIFARIKDTELSKVRNVNGIVCAITFGDSRTVARIPDSQMETFKAFVENEKEVRVIDAGRLRRGVRVEVVAGDFKGKEGLLVSEDGEDLFCVMLEGMSFSIATVLESKLLKVIKKKPAAVKKSKYVKQ